jgi:serine/threonine protein kinase
MAALLLLCDGLFVSTRVPVRAIGVLLYEMLYGQSPFADADQNQTVTFRNIIQAPLVFPPEDDELVPQSARDLIAALLTRDAALRLGCGPLGDHEVKAHPFFQDVNWTALLEKKVPWCRVVVGCFTGLWTLCVCVRLDRWKPRGSRLCAVTTTPPTSLPAPVRHLVVMMAKVRSCAMV